MVIHFSALEKYLKPYVCVKCDKKFSRKSYWKEHERIQTGENSYACSKCEKAFTSASHFQKHELMKHSGTEVYVKIEPSNQVEYQLLDQKHTWQNEWGCFDFRHDKYEQIWAKYGVWCSPFLKLSIFHEKF